jgi:hypothetical protein
VVDKKANIDLLFRNGLKDYEVLPPSDIWRNILPIIRKTQRPIVILRNAALIAVLLSMAFLAYRYGMENLFQSDQNTMLAGGDEPAILVNRTNTPNRRSAAVTSRQEDTPLKNDMTVPQTDVNQDIDDMNGSNSGMETIDRAPDIDPGSAITFPDLRNTLKNISYIAYDNYNAEDNLYKPDFDEPRIKRNRWSVTAMASPTYYMHPELSGSDISDQIGSSEQSRLSYSGGVSFAYKISNKLSIQSGLYYSTIGNEVGGITSFAGFRQYDYTKGDHNFEVLTSSGRIYTNNADVFLLDYSGDRVLTKYTRDVFDPAKANLSYINSSLYQNFSYLEMPFILRYKLIDKSIDFNLIGGLSYNLLINNNVHTIIDGSRYDIGKTADLNSFMVSSSMGMGIEYSFTEKFSLNLEPTFRYYLNPFSEVPGMKTHPYSFGLFSGLSYNF